MRPERSVELARMSAAARRFVLCAMLLMLDSARCGPPFLASLTHGGEFAELERLDPYVDAEQYVRDQKAYRLPSAVLPQSYELNLIPHLSGDFKFTGDVTIKVLVAEETSTILLHSHRLDIHSVKVSQGSRVLPSSYLLAPLTQMLNVTLKTALSPESVCFVAVKFEGVLNDDLVGFYRSKYTAGNGETKWIATTQFEATYARMAFPCFDEPRFRSTFSINIARYENVRIISNMPVKDVSFPIPSLDNRVVDSFHTTPPMPTYLVAFVIGDIHFIANDVEKFRVWAREEAFQDGEYALAEVEGLCEHMHNYTRIGYMLPKLDLTAVPDFDAGAMENWGLTTYREPYVLYNHNTKSTRYREDVSSVVAHELAHQWFGNYVTIAWWDYLWLNEGFATYFQYFLINEMNSHWRLKERLVVEATHYALSIDGISVHHPLNALVNTPAEITQLFDGISYHKGAAIINMIANFYEPYEDFRDTIRFYLKARHEDGGLTTAQDFYDILEAMRFYPFLKRPKILPQGQTMYTFVGSFADQIGYPLLTVTRHTGTVGMDIRIKQTPYRSPRSAKEIPDQTWLIPVSCAGRRKFHMDNAYPEFWVYTKEETILENEVVEDEWFICNVQQTGYYRVNYDKENWNLIKDQLLTAPEEIHPINRAQIMDDSFTFALDEKLSFSVAINILSYLKYERDPLPWYTALQKLQLLFAQFEMTAVGSDLMQFVKDMLVNYFDLVGFDEKPEHEHSTNAIRRILTRVSCDFEASNCVDRALELYYRNDDFGKISGDVMEAVLCTGMRKDSTIASWNRLWKFYKQTNIVAEKETVLSTIGCATNADLHKKYLFKLIDDQDVDIRSQNHGLVFKSVLRYYRGVTSTLNFIKETIPKLSKHKKAREIVLQLLARMRSSVKSKEHVNLLDNAIKEAEKLDQRKYGDITASLELTKKRALTNIRESERRVPELSTAMSGYAKRARPVLDKSSGAHGISPSSISFLLCALIITLRANILSSCLKMSL